LLDAFNESDLILQAMRIPVINGLKCFDAVVSHSDAVLGLEKTLDGAEVGLLPCTLYHRIALQGITFLHRK
jgi:hypothetical protein